MRRQTQSKSLGRLRPALAVMAALALADRAAGADFPLAFGDQGFGFRIYAPDSIEEIADFKVERVFLDHRKLGFFKVQLLPVLVAQGVRVEFGDASPSNRWAETFQSDWLPKVRRSGVEWRDVDVVSQKAGAPRLHAGAAQPMAPGSPAVCVFNDVTLEANGATRRLPRAELRSEAGRPRVVWTADGGDQHLDLFSGEFINHQKPDGAGK